MRVAVVSESDGPGGAGRSAGELMKGLRQRGVEAQMFSRRTAGELNMGGGATGVSRLRAKAEYEAVRLTSSRRKSWFSAALLPDLQWVRVRRYKPDVVSLHWVNAGHIGIETLPLMPRPMVWTLHDMWPLTGGCHYPGHCERYSSRCGHCPVLGSRKARDLSTMVHTRKRLAWRNLDPTIVVASNWTKEGVQRSALFPNAPLVTVPRPIDVETFSVVHRHAAREKLGLPKGATILAAGGHGFLSDPKKGWKMLRDALTGLGPREAPLILMVFGSSGRPDRVGPFQVHSFGVLNSHIDVATVYNAADIVVVPSPQEAFGRVCAEALACGTPVVAFESPGAGELLRNGITGFVVSSYDPASLRKVITTVLDDIAVVRNMRASCRMDATERFSTMAVARTYEGIYAEAIKRHAMRN